MELSDTIDQIIGLNIELTNLMPIRPDQKALLDKKFRLEFNYNSNHIEGNTLTYIETEILLIFDETRGAHSHRDYEEMKASDVAWKIIDNLAKDTTRPLTEAFIKNLNRILLVRPYWKDALTPDGQNTRREISVGDYKKFSNSVRLSNGEIFNYASPSETPPLMSSLVDWLQDEEAKNQLHPIEIAAQLHYKFVRIHPFDDGNGRISRLLMNYILIKNNLPPVIIKSDDKRNYLSALHDADAGNLNSFTTYIANQLIWSLELSIRAARNENIEEQEDWKKKVSVIKKHLSDKDTIKIIKSDEVLVDLINSKILPFIFSLLDQITEFDDLFLHKRVIINHKQTALPLTSATKFNNLDIQSSYRTQAQVFLSFENFTKDPDNAFNAAIQLDFKFLKHKYEIYFNSTPLLPKLYHQDFTRMDYEQIRNEIGRFLVSLIEKNINPS